MTLIYFLLTFIKNTMKKFNGHVIDEIDPSKIHEIKVMTRLKGETKRRFLLDIKNGYLASHLLRQMVEFWYNNKNYKP